jgi:nucleotide-binding universal stress UspA family protein
MSNSSRILVAVDESRASRHAVEYVADLIAGKPGFHVGLCHDMREPHMLEWGGAEDPAVERKVEDEREDSLLDTEQEQAARGNRLMQELKPILAQSGIDVCAQVVQFDEPADRKKLARTILETARERGYGTIVVGRHAFSSQGLFTHHLSDELVHAGDHVAIWIVE